MGHHEPQLWRCSGNVVLFYRSLPIRFVVVLPERFVTRRLVLVS